MTPLRLRFLACAIAVGAIAPLPASAECLNQTIGQLSVPMNTKDAPSSPHVVTGTMTSRGWLEARAAQERHGTSQVRFFLNGKELKPAKAAELRGETLRCSKKSALSMSDRLSAALSAIGDAIISEAEASRYASSYHCNGSGTVEVVLVECWTTSAGDTTCSFRFRQGGRTCGWAIYTA